MILAPLTTRGTSPGGGKKQQQATGLLVNHPDHEQYPAGGPNASATAITTHPCLSLMLMYCSVVHDFSRPAVRSWSAAGMPGWWCKVGLSWRDLRCTRAPGTGREVAVHLQYTLSFALPDLGQWSRSWSRSWLCSRSSTVVMTLAGDGW